MSQIDELEILRFENPQLVPASVWIPHLEAGGPWGWQQEGGACPLVHRAQPWSPDPTLCGL